jgi:hypothetical protein
MSKKCLLSAGCGDVVFSIQFPFPFFHGKFSIGGKANKHKRLRVENIPWKIPSIPPPPLAARQIISVPSIVSTT